MIITPMSIPASFTAKNPSCRIIAIDIVIKDVKKRTAEITADVLASSWINDLDAIPLQRSYRSRANPTIQKLVGKILPYISGPIDDDLGEYLVSTAAHDGLASHLLHKKIPLAELIKEKKGGNPGFDFHTESPANILVFGEAKYSGNINPHKRATSQIIRFFDNEKDIAEIADLVNFATGAAIANHEIGKKGCAAAFSINSTNPNLIFNNALSSPEFIKMTNCDEAYLIGVRIA